jgi:hypothetical protein
MTASAENEDEEETDEDGSVLRELEDGIACFNNKVAKAANLRRMGEEPSAGTLRRPRRFCRTNDAMVVPCSKDFENAQGDPAGARNAGRTV